MSDGQALKKFHSATRSPPESSIEIEPLLRASLTFPSMTSSRQSQSSMLLVIPRVSSIGFHVSLPGVFESTMFPSRSPNCFSTTSVSEPSPETVVKKPAPSTLLRSSWKKNPSSGSSLRASEV